MTLIFNPKRLRVIYTHRKLKFDWTDRRKDKRTMPITLPSWLTRSVTSVRSGQLHDEAYVMLYSHCTRVAIR